MRRKEITELKASASRRVKVKWAFRADVLLLIVIVLGWYFWKDLRDVFSLLSFTPFVLLWLLMLLFPADVTLEEKDSKATRGKTKVLLLLLTSAIYPGLRLLLDQEWLEPLELVWKSAPLFAVLLAGYLLRVTEWRRKIWKLVVATVTLAVFSTAAVGLTNVGLDFKQPVQVVSQVSDKRISRSSKGGTTYYLEAPFEENDRSFAVSRELYAQFEIGDPITINVGSGALGITYARVVAEIPGNLKAENLE